MGCTMKGIVARPAIVGTDFSISSTTALASCPVLLAMLATAAAIAGGSALMSLDPVVPNPNSMT